MEWAGRQLASAVLENVKRIAHQQPDPDDTSHFGMTSYHDRFVGWMTNFEVGQQDVWFAGPLSHPYPA